MKLSKSVLAISIFLGVIVAPTSFISPVKAVADVDILTHSGFLDIIGYYHVVGEAENTGDATLNFVKVTATFYNSSHEVVGTSFTYTTLSILLTGRKSPFEILLVDTAQAAKVDHYILSVHYDVYEPIFPIGLEILSNSSYVDIVGYLHVVGEIKNIGTSATTFVQVAATFYDESDTVVATAFTYSDPSDLDAGEIAPFEIILVYTDRVELVTSYFLTAESDQYAIVPEFLTWTSMLLILIVLTVAIAIYKQRLLKQF